MWQCDNYWEEKNINTVKAQDDVNSSCLFRDEISMLYYMLRFTMMLTILSKVLRSRMQCGSQKVKLLVGWQGWH